MKECRISDRWTLNGLQTIVMENELLRTSILVDLGARIHEFVYKPLDRDFFWHNPRIEPRTPVFQADIDAWLSGGMDEAIPTGHPTTYRNELYPYIGELWSLRWDYDIVQREPEVVEVHLWRYAPISPLRVDRWMLLRRDEPLLHMRHRVTNLSSETFDFLWGLHPCWDVRPTTRFDLPAGEMLIEDSAPNDRLGPKGTRYQWPFATEAATGRVVDVRQMPPPNSGTGEFQFATQLKAGWLAVTDTQALAGAGLIFPNEIFKAAWLWTCAGNWRGYYVGALEAWTGYPQKLHDAVDHGVFYSLPANQVLECETAIVAYHGVGSVSYLGIDGTVKE
jgi:galactose mutarotase-like enzyme